MEKSIELHHNSPLLCTEENFCFPAVRTNRPCLFRGKKFEGLVVTWLKVFCCCIMLLIICGRLWFWIWAWEGFRFWIFATDLKLGICAQRHLSRLAAKLWNCIATCFQSLQHWRQVVCVIPFGPVQVYRHKKPYKFSVYKLQQSKVIWVSIFNHNYLELLPQSANLLDLSWERHNGHTQDEEKGGVETIW